MSKPKKGKLREIKPISIPDDIQSDPLKLSPFLCAQLKACRDEDRPEILLISGRTPPHEAFMDALKSCYSTSGGADAGAFVAGDVSVDMWEPKMAKPKGQIAFMVVDRAKQYKSSLYDWLDNVGRDYESQLSVVGECKSTAVDAPVEFSAHVRCLILVLLILHC